MIALVLGTCAHSSVLRRAHFTTFCASSIPGTLPLTRHEVHPDL